MFVFKLPRFLWHKNEKPVPVGSEATDADGVGVGEVLYESTLGVQVLHLEGVEVPLGAVPHQGDVLSHETACMIKHSNDDWLMDICVQYVRPIGNQEFKQI